MMKIEAQTSGSNNPQKRTTMTPDTPMRQAMQTVYLQLYSHLIYNEQGILKGTNIEYLHKFRISIRKTRTALKLLKGVFTDEQESRYLGLFSDLAKSTNKLRDLDVYHTSKPLFTQRLPSNIRKDIYPFFKQLKKERSQEYAIVKNKLQSVDYQLFKQDWHALITADPYPFKNKPLPERSIFEVACEQMNKTHCRILKIGSSITPSSSDKKLHRLRIECKKLRYLFEFFSPLFPDKTMAVLVKHLKLLQNNLGTFNDLYVQKEFLNAYIKHANLKAEAILALGYLIRTLDEEQKQVRKKFKQSFKNFATQESQLVMQLLLKST